MAAATKTAAKKSPAKKTAAKKSPAKKTTAKKSPAEDLGGHEVDGQEGIDRDQVHREEGDGQEVGRREEDRDGQEAVKKAPAKKSAAAKKTTSAAKKTTKKAPAKKTAAKKATATKSAAKKAPAKKSAAAKKTTGAAKKTRPGRLPQPRRPCRQEVAGEEGARQRPQDGRLGSQGGRQALSLTHATTPPPETGRGVVICARALSPRAVVVPVRVVVPLLVALLDLVQGARRLLGGRMGPSQSAFLQPSSPPRCSGSRQNQNFPRSWRAPRDRRTPCAGSCLATAAHQHVAAACSISCRVDPSPSTSRRGAHHSRRSRAKWSRTPGRSTITGRRAARRAGTAAGRQARRAGHHHRRAQGHRARVSLRPRRHPSTSATRTPPSRCAPASTVICHRIYDVVEDGDIVNIDITAYIQRRAATTRPSSPATSTRRAGCSAPRCCADRIKARPP